MSTSLSMLAADTRIEKVVRQKMIDSTGLTVDLLGYILQGEMDDQSLDAMNDDHMMVGQRVQQQLKDPPFFAV